MKVLKIISVISYLLIDGIQEHGTVNFGLILMYLFQFMHDITHFPRSGIFWEGIITIPIIGTLIILLLAKKNKDKYLVILCFSALLLTVILLTGILDIQNYKRISVGFIFPSTVFVLSSLILIVLNFRKKIYPEN